ncbi:hypothetical protein RND71_031734 [Anisodus tanguticus]|uniref:Uncharacterized protein n=1 Tax=Anisodus tanguticus TaxID=243964 RepID=A0AAE1RCX0_9SOLA|nr:hypothetical protein RND71_031734 [Anisodus tanguticus]
MQQQGDYTTSNPYYNNYPNSTPIPSPPSYASAPPFTATYNTPYNPDLLFYNPPPPAPAPAPLQQPQHSSPFPSFEFHGPYQNPNSSYPSVYPTPNYDNRAKFDQNLDKYGTYVKLTESSGYGSKGARGTSSKSSTWSSSSFDDFGRPIGYNNNNSGKESLSAPTAKIVKAVPKVDTQHGVKSGVQKFRVKLLAESGGQSTQDVLCQVGLLGVVWLLVRR